MQPWDFQSRPFAAFGESLTADFRLVNLTVKYKKIELSSQHFYSYLYLL